MTANDTFKLEPLSLNILVSRKCNFDCAFCIEKTVENTPDRAGLDVFLRKANFLIEAGAVSDVLILGGEPLYYPHLEELVNGLSLSPIITTNGVRLSDKKFKENFPWERIKALNVSIHHYDWEKRKSVTGRRGLSNEEFREALRDLPVPMRINVVLMKDYICSEEDVEKMVDFARSVGVNTLKFSELSGIDPEIHDFIDPLVLSFNREHYCPIPIPEMYRVCHTEGGTHFYKTIRGVDVSFSSAPDYALSGGRDLRGRYYHMVLFNDGKLGFSWRRWDGLYSDEKQFLEALIRNQQENR